MFNSKLFFELCEKYDVEMEEREGGAYIYIGDELQALHEVNLQDVFSGQSYFEYSSDNSEEKFGKIEISFRYPYDLAC